MSAEIGQKRSDRKIEEREYSSRIEESRYALKHPNESIMHGKHSAATAGAGRYQTCGSRRRSSALFDDIAGFDAWMADIRISLRPIEDPRRWLRAVPGRCAAMGSGRRAASGGCRSQRPLSTSTLPLSRGGGGTQSTASGHLRRWHLRTRRQRAARLGRSGLRMRSNRSTLPLGDTGQGGSETVTGRAVACG